MTKDVISARACVWPTGSCIRRCLRRPRTERNQTRNRTGNGKFALATGSWFIDDKFKQRYSNGFRYKPDGAVVCEYPEKPDKFGLVCGYRLDRPLVTCLAELFSGGSVTELGAGVGLYRRAILKASDGRVTSYEAFEGMPDVETLLVRCGGGNFFKKSMFLAPRSPA